MEDSVENSARGMENAARSFRPAFGQGAISSDGDIMQTQRHSVKWRTNMYRLAVELAEAGDGQGTEMDMRTPRDATANYLLGLKILAYICYGGAVIGYAQYAYFKLKNGAPDLESLAFDTAIAMIGLCTQTAVGCLKALDIRMRGLEQAQPEIRTPASMNQHV